MKSSTILLVTDLLEIAVFRASYVMKTVFCLVVNQNNIYNSCSLHVVLKKKKLDSNSFSARMNSLHTTEPDYTFAFNEKNFSDRILKILILPDLVELKPSKGSSSVVDLERKHKHSREEINTRGDDDVDDKQVEEAIGWMEESPPSGIVVTKNHPLRVRTVHISSPILAAKSLLFYKLFLNGTEEQRCVKVQIHDSEEAALMDLLKFIYCNTLSTTTPTGLLDVLIVADKFEVPSCMRYCSDELQILQMTIESTLLYLDLSSKIVMVDAVQPLIDAAKLFIGVHFRDITRFQEEALSLPLSGIKVVLSSDDLQIASEDAVYDFAFMWAQKHYPRPEERREVWNSHLCYLIRFPCMTCMKLKKIMACDDFDQELVSELVLEALFYKAEEPYQQRAIAAEAENAFRHRYVERAYKFRPVKALVFETPHKHCVVYLDLKRQECAVLFPAGKVYSQAFHFGGRELYLSAHCNMDQQGTFYCLGLFLGMNESEPLTLDHEFSVRMSPGNEYVSKHKGNSTLTSGVVVGYRNLCGVAWIPFLYGDSLYFINGILHLRVELAIRE